MEKFETSDGRGLGVRAKIAIEKGQKITEYCGALLSRDEAEEAERRYEERGDSMCYTFWFRGSNGEQLCLDATHSTHISRFFNHSKKRPNIKPRRVVPDNDEDSPTPPDRHPKIVFFARRNIAAGDELLFDYGEDRPHVLRENPWLKQ